MKITAALIKNIWYCFFKYKKCQMNCADETEVCLDCFIFRGTRIECETKYVHPKITEVPAFL